MLMSRHLGVIPAAGAALCLLLPVAAHAATAMISKLSDVSFTNLDPMMAASSSESICVYSSSGSYSVAASGSGANSALTLSAGGPIPDLPYSVLWNSSPGQTGGTSLVGTVLANQINNATALLCTLGLATTASFTIVIASSDLQTAVAGVNYSGTLSLTIRAQ